MCGKRNGSIFDYLYLKVAAEGIGYLLQYSWDSLVAQMVKNPPAKKKKKNPPAIEEAWVRTLGWEDPLEEGMATYPSILAWRIPTDRGAWWAPVHSLRPMTEQLRVRVLSD